MTAPRALLPDGDAADIEAWWTALADTSRAELTRACDPRADDIAQTNEAANPAAWHALPITLRARFVDREALREEAWQRRDLLEWANGHEDAVFLLRERTFHICRVHEKARRVLATGHVPPDFECPLERRDCPFAGALALGAGRAIVLERPAVARPSSERRA